MSGRIETYDSRKEQTSKWSQNEAFSVREAGVDIGKSGGQGGSNVSVDQVVTSGREVAGVTVDGERTPILIPNAGEWTQSDWAETDPSDDAYIKNKPSLAQVATSGDYGDLSNTPDLSDFVEDPNYVHTDYNYDTGAKNIVDHVTDNLAGKVDKVSGKQLSDNNFTNAQKDKLTNLADIYGVGSNLTLDPETNILSANAQPITIDDEMSSSSTNAVQNRVITSALGDKVDKVSGKVLSDNNYTTAEKEKLAGIDQGAEVNDISTISVNGVNVPADVNKNVNLQVSSNTFDVDDFTVTNNEVSIIPAQRIFTGTQAQWNALTLAEKKSYGQANITDDGSGGGGSGGGAIYTTTEQVVGTWLGKPLYQITIPFSGIDTTANVWYPINISSYLDNPEIVFNISDMDYYFVSGALRMFSNTSYEPPNVLLQTQVNRTGISGHVTVRYTKTTD